MLSSSLLPDLLACTMEVYNLEARVTDAVLGRVIVAALRAEKLMRPALEPEAWHIDALDDTTAHVTFATSDAAQAAVAAMRGFGQIPYARIAGSDDGAAAAPRASPRLSAIDCLAGERCGEGEKCPFRHPPPVARINCRHWVRNGGECWYAEMCNFLHPGTAVWGGGAPNSIPRAGSGPVRSHPEPALASPGMSGSSSGSGSASDDEEHETMPAIMTMPMNMTMTRQISTGSRIPIAASASQPVGAQRGGPLSKEAITPPSKRKSMPVLTEPSSLHSSMDSLSILDGFPLAEETQAIVRICDCHHCSAATACVALIPCGHHVLCQQCAVSGNVKLCPVCGQRVVGKLRIHLL